MKRRQTGYAGSQYETDRLRRDEDPNASLREYYYLRTFGVGMQAHDQGKPLSLEARMKIARYDDGRLHTWHGNTLVSL